MAKTIEPVTDDDLGPLMGAKEPSSPAQDKIADLAKTVAELQQQLAGALEAMNRVVASAPAEERGAIQSFAMEVAQLADQGSGRKRVPPETMKKWAAARERMSALIASARAEGRAARYEVTGKIYFANQLIVPVYIASDHTTRPVEIDWDDVPNEYLTPLNDTAKEIHAAFVESIGKPEWKPAEERIGVTPGGVVVHAGTVPAVRQVTTGLTGYEPGGFAGMKIHHKSERGASIRTHILGSIVPPAERRI